MRGSKAMHHLPDCVKEYFTSATDAAEAEELQAQLRQLTIDSQEARRSFIAASFTRRLPLNRAACCALTCKRA